MYVQNLTKEMVIAITNGPVVAPPPPPVLSEKAQKIQDIVNEGFGCEEKNVAAIMSVLLNEPISARKADVNDEPTFGTAVILLKDAGGHNYKLNEVLVYTGYDRVCIKKDGAAGNHAPLEAEHMGNLWRKATVEEIEKAFTE